MKQITLVSEDHPGFLADVSEAMAAAGVNIENLMAQAIGNTAVIIMTVDKYDEALHALAQTPYQAVSEDGLVVQIDDKPGALALITRRLKDANINMRSVRILRRGAGKCIVALATERTQEALALLKDVLVS